MGKIMGKIRVRRGGVERSWGANPRRGRRAAAVGSAMAVVLSALLVVVGIPGVESPSPAAAAGSVITVDGPTPAGYLFLPTCRLDDAIRSANDDRSHGGCTAGTGDEDRIVLAVDIELDGELPVITEGTVIDGHGHDIDANGRRGFRVEGADAVVVLENLAVRNARLVGVEGAECIFAYEGCLVDGVGGAALHVSDGADVTLDRVRLEENEVRGARGRVPSGLAWFAADHGGRGGDALGVVYVEDSTLTVLRSLVTDNTAVGGPGGVGQQGRRGREGSSGDCGDLLDRPLLPGRGLTGNYGGHGGRGGSSVAGIYATGSEVVVKQSTIVDNTADGGRGGPGGSGGAGGAGGSGMYCTKMAGSRLSTVHYAAGQTGRTGQTGLTGLGGSAHAAVMADGGTTVLEASTVVDNTQTITGSLTMLDMSGEFVGIDVGSSALESLVHAPRPREGGQTRSSAVAGDGGLSVRSSTIADNDTFLPFGERAGRGLFEYHPVRDEVLAELQEELALDDPGLSTTEGGASVSSSVVGRNRLMSLDGTSFDRRCVNTFQDLGRNALDGHNCAAAVHGTTIVLETGDLETARTEATAAYTVPGVDPGEAWLPVLEPDPTGRLVTLSRTCATNDVRFAVRPSGTCSAGAVEPVTTGQTLPNLAPTASEIPTQAVLGWDSSVEGSIGIRSVLGRDVGSYFSDPDTGGENLTISFADDPADGSRLLDDAQLAPDDLYLWLKPDAYGMQHVSLRATDPGGRSVTATFLLRVDHPGRTQVVDDSYTTPSATPLDGNVLDNDLVNRRSRLPQVYSSPEHGTLVFRDDGSFTYGPEPGFRGRDRFTYVVAENPPAGQFVGTLHLGRVDIAVGDRPTAGDDAFEIDEDEVLVVADVGDGVLANDDPRGSTVAIEAVLHGEPADGSVDLDPDGTFTYTPDPDFFGTDRFTYRASGDTTPSDVATVTITVAPVNDAPRGESDRYDTGQNQVLVVPASVGVMLNDHDPDGDDFEVVRFTQPPRGSVSWRTDSPAGGFTYQPTTNTTGLDSFTYVLSDGTVESSPVTVTVNVVAGDTELPPVTQPDEYETPQGVPLIVSPDSRRGVLGNDVDPEGRVLTAELRSRPQHGTLAFAPDGSFHYVPPMDFHGVDTFSYCARDGDTCVAAPELVTIRVIEGDVAPVGSGDSYSVTQGQQLVVSSPGLLANDRGVSGVPLRAALATGPRHGTIEVDEIGDTGQFAGGFRYRPSDGFWGRDSFSYELHQGDQRAVFEIWVEIEVERVVDEDNTAPVAVDDSYEVKTDRGLHTTFTDGVLANDVDEDGDFLRAELVDGPAGVFTFRDDGTFVYRSQVGFTGVDSFTYRAFDGEAWSDEATATITVTPNRVPVPTADRFEVAAGTTLQVDAPGVLGNDVDPDGDDLRVTGHTDPEHGSLTLGDDGALTYEAELGRVGEVTFTYTAGDGEGSSDPATVTIAVRGENHAPEVTEDEYGARVDEVFVVDAAAGVLANDVDPDGDPLTAALVDAPASGLIDLRDDGSFTYWPLVGFEGDDTFTYTASDGALTSGPVTVRLRVDGANRAPIGADDEFSVMVGQSLSVDAPGLLANDEDLDGDELTVVEASDVTSGTLAVGDDGGFTYTPDPGFTGTASFTYRADDGDLTSEPTTVTFHVGDFVLHVHPDRHTVPLGEEIDPIRVQGGYSDGDDTTGVTDPEAAGRPLGDDSDRIGLVVGGLPDGLTFTAVGGGAGTIAGTPTARGSWTATVTATIDGDGRSITREVTFDVLGARPVLDGIPALVEPTEAVSGVARGFAPGEEVTVHLEIPELDAAVVVGRGEADDEGAAVLALVVPEAPDGPVRFVAVGHLTELPAVADSEVRAAQQATTTTSTTTTTSVPPETTTTTTGVPPESTTTTTIPSDASPGPDDPPGPPAGAVGTSGDGGPDGAGQAGSGGPGTESTSGELPGTGAPTDVVSALLLSLVLLGAGVFLIALRRRSLQHDHPA